MDAFQELAMKDTALKEDPTRSISEDEVDTNVFFVKGICYASVPVIHPENKKLFIWILLGIVFVIYECFLTPYRLCFDAPAQGVFYVFESLVNSYFIADVCLNFFVSFHDHDGLVVKVHSYIVKNYLRGWFGIDVIASMPIDWILLVLDSDDSRTGAERAPKVLRTFRIARFIKMTRILRIGKLRAFAEHFEQELVGSKWRLVSFAMLKILLVLMLIAHVAGCFWYFIGESSQDRYGTSWIISKMPEYDVDEGLNKSTFYLWSCHFSLATMSTVGYGDISPTNTAELLYTGILLWVSLVVFSACIGALRYGNQLDLPLPPATLALFHCVPSPFVHLYRLLFNLQ